MSYFLLFTFFSSVPKALYQRKKMESLPPEAFPDLAAIFESVDGWNKEGCSDLIKGWCSLIPSLHKHVSSDFYVSDTRYTEMGNTADPALKSLEVLWALKQGGVLWRKGGFEMGGSQLSRHGEWSFKRTKLHLSSCFTGQNVLGQDCDSTKNKKGLVTGKRFLTKTCRRFVFLYFYRQTFYLSIIYTQKSTETTSGRLHEFLQRERTVVTRTQTKKQNVTKRLRVPSRSRALELHTSH